MHVPSPNSLLSLMVLAGFLGAAEPSVPGGVPWIGYRGPQGSGIVNAEPPTSCDESSGTNILWKVPMPNWGHSQPIVCGDRVFVISEGGWPENQDLPLLQVLDLATGKEITHATLDHLAVSGLSKADQDACRSAWHDVMAAFRKDYALFNQWIYGDATAKADAEAQWKALGRNYGGWKGGGYGQLRSLKPKCDEAKAKIAAKAGLTQATWQHACGMGQACFGQTFPTPVTDGTNVYIATAFGSFFCFDKEGKLLWNTYAPGTPGEYCRNGRSPLIYGNLLISDVTAKVRGMDRKTGQVLWSHPVDDETWMNPLVITTGGKDVLLCFNNKAFLLPGGEPLTLTYERPEGAAKGAEGEDVKTPYSAYFGAGGSMMKYDEPDIAFFTGGGEHGGWANKGKCEVQPPCAVRFSLSGTNLKGKVLWNGIKGVGKSSHTGLLYYKGLLYHTPTGSTVDALTGVLKSGTGEKSKGKDSFVVPSKHFSYIAGGHQYGLSPDHGAEGKPGQKATLSVMTLDGKKVADSTFANAPVEGQKKQQIIEQNGYNTWMFSYASTFAIHGDRIFVRSYDYLWCIGKK